MLVPSAGADVGFLVCIAACAARPGCLQMAGVGWATPPFTCTPQTGLQEEETRAQASSGEQIAGISSSKTLRGGAVNSFSAYYPPRHRGGQAGDGTHLGELPCSERPAWGRFRRVGPSSPLQVCSSAAVKGRLCSLLASGGFVLHSRISPQTGLFCSNRLYPIQKTGGNLSLLPLPEFL